MNRYLHVIATMLSLIAIIGGIILIFTLDNFWIGLTGVMWGVAVNSMERAEYYKKKLEGK